MSTILENPASDLASTRSLRVLVVDEEIPYPLTSGKRIRTFNLLRHLADRHSIKFLCHRNMVWEERAEAQKAFDALGIETIFLDRSLPKQTLLTSKPKLFCQLTKNLFSRYPFLVEKQLSSELCQRIREFVELDEIDLVHFEWTPYAAAVREIGSGVFSKPWVVDAHNVESLIWKRYFQNEGNPLKRWFIRNQWKKLDRFEKEVFQTANETVFVSEPDSLLGSQEYGCVNGQVVDNGVDTGFFVPDPGQQRRPHELLFLGSLDWRPNVDGVQLLVEKILPEIVRSNPQVHLNIVGRKPADWLIELIARTGNVTLYADVPDVRPFLQICGMLVVPLRIGGGSRLKILEALACQTPVISTQVGAEGLHLAAGQHFVVADEKNMARRVIDCIEDFEQLSRTAVAGRDTVLNRYDWKVLSRKLEELWLSTIIASS